MNIAQGLYSSLSPRASWHHAVRTFRQRRHHRRCETALRAASGVVHVGANTGQERELYHAHGLNVVWVEPIPAVFEELERNVAGFPKQRCVQALVADVDGREMTLHISSNDGASSSVFELGEHRDIWPEIAFVHDVRVSSVTLPTLLRAEGVNLEQHRLLAMDTQGSELMILKGAGALLREFQFISTEAADFEAYIGCAKRQEITAFLESHGFEEWSALPFAERPSGGRYYDILYRNREGRHRG